MDDSGDFEFLEKHRNSPQETEIPWVINLLQKSAGSVGLSQKNQHTKPSRGLANQVKITRFILAKVLVLESEQKIAIIHSM